MEPFTTLSAPAVALNMINIDTDMIIPKQFLSTVERRGLARGLFYELRFAQDGSEIADFPLNKPEHRAARVLIAGDNFGCGSSREHAPWALADWGFRCIIAPSFADIFRSNCLQNGILPIAVPQDLVDDLMRLAAPGAPFEIDLAAQTIRAPNAPAVHFDIDPVAKARLLEGLDDIGMTLKSESAISRFEAARSAPTAP